MKYLAGMTILFFVSNGAFADEKTDLIETEELASSAALARLLSEPEINGKALPGHTLLVKMVHEMPKDHKNEYRGFTLFPME